MSRSPAGDASFRKALESRRFASVYYFHGDDDYRKEQALRDLIAAAVEPGTRDFNLDVLDGRQAEAESLATLLSTPPMMAERRVVVVRDVGALGKAARAALDVHIEALRGVRTTSPEVVLVLLAASGEKAKSDKALEGLATTLKLEPLGEEQLPPWIIDHVGSALDATITPEAAALLAAAVGNDLTALSAELDKLASFVNGAPIDERAVDAVVGVRRGETLADLLDRVGMRDAAGALALVSHVLEQPKMTAVSVVMTLTVQALALAWGEALRSARSRPPDFFDLLKTGGSTFIGRPWGEAATAWRAALPHWTADDLDAALEALLAADMALKETRLSSDEQLLETLVLAMCLGRAASVGVP